MERLVTFQEEKFTDVETEIANIMHDHWREVTLRPDVPLDPNWDAYHLLQEQGTLTTITARCDNELVGYVLLLTSPTLHYKSVIMAHDDAFFLKKEYRKGLTAAKLFQKAEEVMHNKGAHRICFHEKPTVKTGKLFKFLGYHVEETVWMKGI